MQKVVLISILFFLNFLDNFLLSQTVFEIEIDEIYLDDTRISFVNIGELNSYLCKLTPIVIKDFEHKLILDCEEDNNWMWSDSPTKIELDELIAFEQPEKLIKHIENTKFANSSNQTNHLNHSFLQHFNENLFSSLYFNNLDINKPKWEFQDVDFWDYVFIRINKKYLIIALVYENDARLGGYIIPKKNETIVVAQNYVYKEAGRKIDTIKLEKYISLESFYRVKTTSNGKQIVDKLFQEKVINKKFDRVTFKKNHILTQSANMIELYDKSCKQLHVRHVQAAFDSLGSIQCIINNEIKWLDYDFKIHDTFPINIWGFCGTISSTDRKIVQINNLFYEYSRTGYGGLGDNRNDSILILEDKSVSHIKYLNNMDSDQFDEYSDLFSVFSYPYSYYVLTKGNQKQLISLTNKKDAKAKEILNNNIFSAEVSRDSINNLLGKLQNEIELKVHFTGDFETFGYNHPIKFKSDNLYGYFPQNKEAKYRRLEKFNFFFAEFEDTKGRNGWIDIYGNEYYKKN